MDLLRKYKVNCESILHIGGHFAEEAALYYENGIKHAVFVEGDANLFPYLESIVKVYPNYSCTLAMLSNQDGYSEFYVASNEGASSSILKPNRHTIERPDITFGDSRLVRTTTLDSLGLDNFDLLVIDVQGAELLVIEGGLRTITNAKAIWIEVNAGFMYEGSADSSQIVLALAEIFVPVYMNMNENKWGDALFIRKDLIQ